MNEALTERPADDAVPAGFDALAASATDEWADLVAAAVLGTDRRPAPAPRPGWDTWGRASDPAVALLDRAAAVVVARRAGACPSPPPSIDMPRAPIDERPPCPHAVAVRLGRLLSGEHDELLPEWFQRCAEVDVQLPWAALPALLLRGRRHPRLDAAVRQLARGRASWLAEVLPELGVKVAQQPVPDNAAPFAPPPRPPDSGAVVTTVLTVFHERMATWNTAREMCLAAASIDPVWLPALIAELSRIGFDPVIERTRREVLTAAEFRHAMLLEFAAVADASPSSAATDAVAPIPPAPRNTGDPS